MPEKRSRTLSFFCSAAGAAAAGAPLKKEVELSNDAWNAGAASNDAWNAGAASNDAWNAGAAVVGWSNNDTAAGAACGAALALVLGCGMPLGESLLRLIMGLGSGSSLGTSSAKATLGST